MSDTTDKINEENGNKYYKIAKEGSEYEDEKDKTKTLVDEYNNILGDIDKSQDSYSDSHKDRILRLAKILDETNKTKKEKICSKVCQDVTKFGIKERYVRKILPDEYKDVSKVRDEFCGPRAANPEQEEEEQKQPIAVGADGQTIPEEQDPEQQSNPVSNLYGKSLEQMKREADNEVDEDMEETLENPRNQVPHSNTALISDKSEERLNFEAQISELKQALDHQTEIANNAVEQHKKILKQSPRTLSYENAELKAKNSNLETILSNSNEEILREHTFKEIEILKLSALRDQQIRMISAKSQKTLFLWVNPRTMEILDIKTDTEQHRLAAIRKREKESESQQGGAVA